MNKLFAELRRRNMFRVAGVYAVVGWILAQASGVLEEALGLPQWFDTLVVSLVLLGFPIAMLLAWAFEMTPEGVKRTEDVDAGESVTAKTAKTLDYIIIGGLVLVAALVVGNRLLPERTLPPGAPGSAAIDTFTGQSIAVLPFEDFSQGKDQEYFADGIAEELLNVLARVDGLRVASRTSAFSYKGREVSIAEIGQALNVAHILEGSVRKAGNTLRITAQLIDTKTDEHLWSETYDRPLTAENVFEIQDEISKAIVLELNGRLDLLPKTGSQLTRSTEALESYLKGKEAYGPRNAEGIETGITELIRAVTLDPQFAVAHAKLARAYRLANEYGELGQASASARSDIHIDRAIALAPNDWDVLAEYAWWLESDRQYSVDRNVTMDEVVAAFDAAIAANPNNAEAHRGKGYTLSNGGRLDEAKIALEHAKTLNPREPLIYMNLMGIAGNQGDLVAMKSLATEAVLTDPDALYPRTSLAGAHTSLGEVETAHRIYQSCRVERACVSGLAYLYFSLGVDASDLGSLKDFDLVLKHYVAGDFDRVVQMVSAIEGPSPIAKARFFSGFGRWDAAYKLIEEYPSEFAPLLAGLPANDAEAIAREIALLATLEQHNDLRASALRASLSKKYQDAVPPGELTVTDVYTNGAAWAMLDNDPDRAMVWLNALADRGISAILFQPALFEPLTPRADYQAFRARMDSYTARDRALIEAQLANPPEIWWTPDELSKGNE